jgi:TRAP-type C4-dicarboxylate transport system permease small subunit
MFKTIKNYLDKSLEFVTAFTMGFLVLDVTWQVITRYILKNPSSWTEEVATYLVMWVGLLGAAVALNRGSHLGIDYFVAKLTVRKRLITQAFVFFVIFAFSLLILLIGGLQLVTDTLQLGQTTPATGVKVGYWYLSIPISGFFISIYSCEYFVEVLMKIKKDVS